MEVHRSRGACALLDKKKGTHFSVKGVQQGGVVKLSDVEKKRREEFSEKGGSIRANASPSVAIVSRANCGKKPLSLAFLRRNGEGTGSVREGELPLSIRVKNRLVEEGGLLLTSPEGAK